MYGKHLGTDYATPTGTVVVSPVSGRINNQGLSASVGNWIEIAGVDGRLHRVLHLSKREIVTGAQVSEGQRIGLSGSTGSASTGPHLHWDARKSGTNIYSGFDSFFDTEKLYQDSQVVAPPSGAKTLYLKPTTSSYAFYRPGTPLPVKRANRAGELNPQKWGGLTYPILRTVAPNTYEVKSPSLGVIWVWAGDSDSEVRS